jgi:hypothetical protein
VHSDVPSDRESERTLVRVRVGGEAPFRSAEYEEVAVVDAAGESSGG